MKNMTSYPDYMIGMNCTKPHHQQPERVHEGEKYECRHDQKRVNHYIDLMGNGEDDAQ